jgi:hypothetical protein
VPEAGMLGARENDRNSGQYDVKPLIGRRSPGRALPAGLPARKGLLARNVTRYDLIIWDEASDYLSEIFPLPQELK